MLPSRRQKRAAPYAEVSRSIVSWSVSIEPHPAAIDTVSMGICRRISACNIFPLPKKNFQPTGEEIESSERVSGRRVMVMSAACRSRLPASTVSFVRSASTPRICNLPIEPSSSSAGISSPVCTCMPLRSSLPTCTCPRNSGHTATPKRSLSSAANVSVCKLSRTTTFSKAKSSGKASRTRPTRMSIPVASVATCAALSTAQCCTGGR